MNPPQVLIERSVVQALCDPASPHHRVAATAFLPLVQQFETNQLLLVAVSDHLIPPRRWYQAGWRRGVLAPIDSLPVGNQHRRTARRMHSAGDFDTALTMVMCQRHKVQRMLTLDANFRRYPLDVELIGVESADVAKAGDGDDARG
ncbi:MAG: hypothetical protein HY826_09960 [Actinobacteria bacterium]|nr:hypothetical protein [Actinomycetota bacterium]